MSQTITFEKLIDWQSQQDPVLINDSLSLDSNWVANQFDYDFKENSFEWYKSAGIEEFDFKEVDQLTLNFREGYDYCLLFITGDSSVFQSIYSDLESSDFILQDSTQYPSKMNYYEFATQNQFIQVFEPLSPNPKTSRYNHVFMIYRREDYENGFVIR